MMKTLRPLLIKPKKTSKTSWKSTKKCSSIKAAKREFQYNFFKQLKTQERLSHNKSLFRTFCYSTRKFNAFRSLFFTKAVVTSKLQALEVKGAKRMKKFSNWRPATQPQLSLE